MSCIFTVCIQVPLFTACRVLASSRGVKTKRRIFRECSTEQGFHRIAMMSASECPCSLLTLERFVFACTVRTQQVSSLQNEGARNVLANKFTSEAPANVNTGATMAVSPGGLVSAALPAGLTLRTSAKSDIASAASSLSKPRR